MCLTHQPSSWLKRPEWTNMSDWGTKWTCFYWRSQNEHWPHFSGATGNFKPLFICSKYLDMKKKKEKTEGQVNKLNQDVPGYFVMASDMVAHVDHLRMQCEQTGRCRWQGAKMNIYLVEGWKQTTSLTKGPFAAFNGIRWAIVSMTCKRHLEWNCKIESFHSQYTVVKFVFLVVLFCSLAVSWWELIVARPMC